MLEQPVPVLVLSSDMSRVYARNFGFKHTSTLEYCFLGCEAVLFGKKGNIVPLQAWSGPEGSRKLRFPDFMTTAQDGGKVASLSHRPTLSPGNAPGTHFC
jgi:hypothetical protein